MRFPIGLTTSLSAYIIRKKLEGERFVPLVLMLEPLFACNLHCTTCGRIREYKDRASEMLSLDECLSASRECEAPIVSICGGEPLIYPWIEELVDGLIRMRRYVYLCTNGVLLAEKIRLLRPSNRLLLNVHIDGPREVHDMVVEKPGAFDAAIEGIKSARELGFAVTVNTTVCKQTDMQQIDGLMTELDRLSIAAYMLSPAYSYEAIEDQSCFMSRKEVHAKFAGIDDIASRHRLADTPVYLEFLQGLRELDCTAWGNPTRNIAGWRSPCYLLADRHYPTYQELIDRTDWSAYGPGADPRCENCMVHCGFEPSAALMTNKRPGDLWKMLRWQL